MCCAWIDEWQSSVEVEQNLENAVHLIGLRAFEIKCVNAEHGMTSILQSIIEPV